MGWREEGGREAREGRTVKGRGKLADAADNRVLVRQVQQRVALGAERHGAARGHGVWMEGWVVEGLAAVVGGWWGGY